MAVCQNLVPLVNIKIAGKWMFIPLKMVLIGIDPYPYRAGHHHQFTGAIHHRTGPQAFVIGGWLALAVVISSRKIRCAKNGCQLLLMRITQPTTAKQKE
jgi:hypothetical protein